MGNSIKEIDIIKAFMRQTEYVATYSVIPHFLEMRKHNNPKKIILKFYDYNVRSLLEFADVIRPVVFTNKEGINQKDITKILKKINDEDINGRVDRYKSNFNSIKESRIVDCESFAPNDYISFFIIKDSKIFKGTTKVSEIKNRNAYTHMYLYSQKWHTDLLKKDSLRNQSSHDQRSCFISTITYLDLLVDTILELRGICDSALKRGFIK